MKHLLIFSILFILFVGLSSSTSGQAAGGNVVIVTRAESSLSQEGSVAEFDSLTALYNANVWDKNPLVISHKTIRHWWGNNNRDIIDITEVASWEDVILANEKNTELFEATWKTKEEQDAFNKAYDKYFTGAHSDEIYREVIFTKSLTQN